MTRNGKTEVKGEGNALRSGDKVEVIVDAHMHRAQGTFVGYENDNHATGLMIVERKNGKREVYARDRVSLVERKMKAPKKGDRVWIARFDAATALVDGKRIEGVTAGIHEREFERAHTFKGEVGDNRKRWILVVPGRPHGKGYGMSYNPDRVFATKAEAMRVLTGKIESKISELELALIELKGGE